MSYVVEFAASPGNVLRSYVNADVTVCVNTGDRVIQNKRIGDVVVGELVCDAPLKANDNGLEVVAVNVGV